MFRDFLKLLGIIEEQAIEFLKKGRQNPQWAQDNLMRDFVHLTPKGQKLIKRWLGFLSAL
jgi:DNA-binding MarR family transcriptional regulator